MLVLDLLRLRLEFFQVFLSFRPASHDYELLKYHTVHRCATRLDGCGG